MLEILKKTPEAEGWNAENFASTVLSSKRPLLLKNFASEWPLVQAGEKSSAAALDYLKARYNGRPTRVYHGDPEIGGKFYYNDDFSGLNFKTHVVDVADILDKLRDNLGAAAPPSYYIASNSIPAHFPDLLADNDLHVPLGESPIKAFDPLISIWIGSKTLVSCHWDAQQNIACCAVGKRRFTIFPPDQIANLYPGPLDPTPGGQTVSLVDFSAPDFDRFPRFRQALEHAEVADMEAGDALFLPSMWWHQVEAFSEFNVLVNYWWGTAPKYMGPAVNSLHHALLSLRDRPQEEKEAWRRIFDYYIFGDADIPRAHIPENAWGDLGPMDETRARQLRTALLNKLNR